MNKEVKFNGLDIFRIIMGTILLVLPIFLVFIILGNATGLIPLDDMSRHMPKEDIFATFLFLLFISFLIAFLICYSSIKKHKEKKLLKERLEQLEKTAKQSEEEPENE